MQEEHKIKVTIIVIDKPEEKSYPPDMKVEEVIKSLLSDKQKQDWNQYQLSDRSKPLDPNQSLEANGVKDGDTLSFTKKQGGGGPSLP